MSWNLDDSPNLDDLQQLDGKPSIIRRGKLLEEKEHKTERVNFRIDAEHYRLLSIVVQQKWNPKWETIADAMRDAVDLFLEAAYNEHKTGRDYAAWQILRHRQEIANYSAEFESRRTAVNTLRDILSKVEPGSSEESEIRSLAIDEMNNTNSLWIINEIQKLLRIER